MKIYKLYESVHDDLTEKLQKIIRKDKTINGFEFSYDNMSGTFEWNDDEYLIYASPYWENYKRLPINIMNIDGDEINYESVELPTLKTEDDVTDCLDFYYEQIYRVTSLLNKRSDLKNKIEIIKKSVGDVFIVEFGFRINKIIVDQIPDSNVNNLLDIIDRDYPDIIISNKYNL